MQDSELHSAFFGLTGSEVQHTSCNLVARKVPQSATNRVCGSNAGDDDQASAFLCESIRSSQFSLFTELELQVGYRPSLQQFPLLNLETHQI